MSSALLIEGYAAVFGLEDLGRDTVRAGAFSRSLRSAAPPMLLQHKAGAVAGRWTRIVEDGRGLFVRGLIESEGAAAFVRGGLDGLSIGFRTRLWRPLGQGRELIDLELVEISLVAEPMQPGARFEVLTPQRARAA